MNKDEKKAIFIDINEAIKICHKCENFKNLPVSKPNFPVYFCVNANDNFNRKSKKYLPCIIENVSQKCMANFLIKDINFSEKSLFALD